MNRNINYDSRSMGEEMSDGDSTVDYETAVVNSIRKRKFQRLCLGCAMMTFLTGILLGTAIALKKYMIHSRNQPQFFSTDNYVEEDNVRGNDVPSSTFPVNTDTADNNDFRLVVPPAPSDLSTHCAYEQLQTVTGIANCESRCMEAECCFPNAQPNCFLENKVLCDGYRPCNQVMKMSPGMSTVTHLELEQETVEEACSAESVSTEMGYYKCSNYCSQADCCFKEHACDPNEPLGVTWCLTFDSCANLQTAVSVSSFASLVMACSREASTECIEACRPALCCFLDGVPCQSEKVADGDVCDLYFPCQILAGHETMVKNHIAGSDSDTSTISRTKQNVVQEIQDVPHVEVHGSEAIAGESGSKESIGTLGVMSVEEACDESNSDYLSNCKEVCEPKFCCFSADPKDACKFDNVIDTCNKYTTCEWIYIDLMESSIADRDVNFEAPPMEEQVTMKQQAEIFDASIYPPVFELCNKESFEQEVHDGSDGTEACREVCVDAECCHTTKVINNCATSRPLFCNHFAACEELKEWDYQHGLTIAAAAGAVAQAPNAPGGS